MQIETFPTQEELIKFERGSPEYMHPNRVPFAVILEGFLDREYCEELIEILDKFDTQKHAKCGGVTREIGHIAPLDYARSLGHVINKSYWGYDLDDDVVTWMQTYEAGVDTASYQLHMDAGPGRMRKLTAVTFLSDPDTYAGGDLEVYFHPMSKRIPRTQGTVVLFQPWILHEVHPVVLGTRKSLNTSFWGPNFK